MPPVGKAGRIVSLHGRSLPAEIPYAPHNLFLSEIEAILRICVPSTAFGFPATQLPRMMRSIGPPCPAYTHDIATVVGTAHEVYQVAKSPQRVEHHFPYMASSGRQYSLSIALPGVPDASVRVKPTTANSSMILMNLTVDCGFGPCHASLYSRLHF